MEVHEAAKKELFKAMELPNAEKESIKKKLEPVYLRIASMTRSKEESIKAITAAIEIKDDPSSYFLRMMIYMEQEEFKKAVKDGETILKLDKNFMNG